MDSSLSPVWANIYMEYFEEIALGSAPLKPSMWLRYVEDTFSGLIKMFKHYLIV